MKKVKKVATKVKEVIEVAETAKKVKGKVEVNPSIIVKIIEFLKRLAIVTSNLGAWPYVSRYYSKVVSTAGIAGILYLFAGPQGSDAVKSLQYTVDSLNSVVQEQSSVIALQDSVIININSVMTIK